MSKDSRKNWALLYIFSLLLLLYYLFRSLKVPRLRRKAEKALRQIEDLKAKLAVNG